MQQKQMRITLIIGLVYVVAAMWIMLYAATHRVVVIQDVTQGQMLSSAESEESRRENSIWKAVELTINEEMGKDIVIPLETELKAEQVTIENHYMEKEVWIGLDGVDKDFFEKNPVSGNLSLIEEAVYGKQKGLVWLRFKLADVYECKSILEDTHLCIELVKPKEIYEKVVVLDPWYNESAAGVLREGMTEKEITLDIAKRLEEKMKADDSIKIYYTRMDEEEPSLEARQNIIKETEADFYIGIMLNEDTDTAKYGVETVYNGTYFIPGVGSVELADCLERNVTLKVSGRANGLTQAGEEDIIVQKATVPAALLKAGYLSNEKEAALLNSEGYREWIAEGIWDAVQEAYEKMENEAETE